MAARQVRRAFYLDIAAHQSDFTGAPREARPLPAPAHLHESHSIECDVMDEGMTRSDLIFVLENLRFNRDDLSRLQIDRGVRDYLLVALRVRAHRP